MKQVLLVTGASLILVFGISKSVLAQNSASTATTSCTFTSDGEQQCQLDNPIADTEVTKLIRTVITAALGFMGALTLVMFVWGGATWLMSAGNPEKVSAGTKTMVWALIGVLVVLLSYVALSGFLKYLTT